MPATLPKNSRWTGSNDQGPRNYTPAQVDAVLAHLARCRARETATTVEIVAQTCNINGRALRQMFSDLDGERFLLAYQDDLIWWAQNGIEAEGFTRRLEGQAIKMARRVAKRRAFAERLGLNQGSLF